MLGWCSGFFLADLVHTRHKATIVHRLEVHRNVE